MKQRIAYILKHNAYVQAVYRIVMSCIFRIMSYFVKTDKKLILFVSFMGKGCNDSPKVIFDYLVRHDAYRGYRCIWAVEDPKRYIGIDTVKIDTLSYFLTALRAGYWVTNTGIERGLRFKKKDQVYLNTWHGVPLKYIGNDCPGRKDFDFSNIDYLCVCSDHDERVYKRACKALKSSYIRSGLPRNDALWNVVDKDALTIRQQLQLPLDKIIILYAPTWRESTDRGKSYAFDPPLHFNRWKAELGSEYLILFRAHHQTTQVLGLVFDDFVRDVSDYQDINNLFIAADILITDYSAVAFDYAILCKPMLCYAYDYDEFLSKRGVYFDIDGAYPNKSCRTEDELLQRIQGLDYAEECHNTEAFRNVFMKYGGNATEECVRALLGN